MFGPGTVHLSVIQKLPTEAIQARIADPTPAIEQWPAVMRKGDGSVQDQHQRQAMVGRNGRVAPWPRTKAFGNQPAPAQTLKREGRYLAAWTGDGPGAITRVTRTGAAIGVSAAAVTSR